MRKEILSLFVMFFSTGVILSQSAFHNDDITIGMSYYEVESIESSSLIEKESSEIAYLLDENSNGINAKITYKFRSNKLEEIKYRILAPSDKKQTCESYMDLRDRISYLSHVISFYKNEGFECQLGWHLLNSTMLPSITGDKEDYYNCGIGKEVELIDAESKRKNNERAIFNLDKEEYSVDFTFNLLYNYKDQENNKYIEPRECDDDFYSILGWITVSK